MKYLLSIFFFIISQNIYSKGEIFLLINCFDKETHKQIELKDITVFNKNKKIDFELKNDGMLVLNSSVIKDLTIKFLGFEIDFGKYKKLKRKKYIELQISINRKANKEEFEINHHNGDVIYILKNCKSKNFECNEVIMKTPTALVVNTEGTLELYNANKVFNKYLEFN